MADNLLLEARDQIDEADKMLIKAFEQRMNAVINVAKYKAANNMPIVDRERELKVIAKCQGLLENHDYDESVEALMEGIMQIAKDYEAKLLGREI